MVVSTFSVLDKDSRERIFKKNFLLADVKPEIVLGISFLTMSNADIDFQARDLQWRSYTNGDVLSTTKQVKLIEKKKFATAVLDPEHEAFVVHVASLSIDLSDEVHPLKRAEIAYLKADETSIEVPSEYADFANVFSPKHGISNHALE